MLILRRFCALTNKSFHDLFIKDYLYVRAIAYGKLKPSYDSFNKKEYFVMNSIEVCDCDCVHSDCVNKAKAGMISENNLQKVCSIFKVLGDPTRMKIVCALDKSEMCVCDLAAALDMTKSAISHQLNTLKQSNVVKFRRDGKNVFYSLDDQHITDMIETALQHAAHK